MSELNQIFERWRDDGERIAMATVIRVEGSAPRGEGAKMLVSRSGRIFGSVSGGCVEGAVADQAQQVLGAGSPATVRYGIDKGMIWDIGLSCGGVIDVFVEQLRLDALPEPEPGAVPCTIVNGERAGEHLIARRSPDETWTLDGSLGDPQADEKLLTLASSASASGASRVHQVGPFEIFVDPQVPESRLIIVGAVHIAVALCAAAARSGFSVTVVDPRPQLNDRERFPAASQLIVEWPEDALPALRIDQHCYIAVLAHDEKFDDPTLDFVLRRAPRYVGAIGSKKTQAKRRQRLIDAGIPLAAIDSLRAPIGLDIGAQSPDEIAIAILAEMIAAKYDHDGAPLKDRAHAHIHAH